MWFKSWEAVVDGVGERKNKKVAATSGPDGPHQTRGMRGQPRGHTWRWDGYNVWYDYDGCVWIVRRAFPLDILWTRFIESVWISSVRI